MLDLIHRPLAQDDSTPVSLGYHEHYIFEVDWMLIPGMCMQYVDIISAALACFWHAWISSFTNLVVF